MRWRGAGVARHVEEGEPEVEVEEGEACQRQSRHGAERPGERTPLPRGQQRQRHQNPDLRLEAQQPEQDAAGCRGTLEQPEAAVEKGDAEEGVLARQYHPGCGRRDENSEPAPWVISSFRHGRRRGGRRHEDGIGLGRGHQAERQQHEEPGRRIDERPEAGLGRDQAGEDFSLVTREGFGVVDQCQLAFEEGARGRMENQEIGERVDHQPDLRAARPFEDDVEHIIQADDSAEGRGDPQIEPRPGGHSLYQVVKSCSGARSVMRLLGTASGSA